MNFLKVPSSFSFHCTILDDNCTNQFTPNQMARMHCYLDLYYQNWLTDRQPSSIPLAPIVTDQSPTSVTIYWLPPLRGSLYQRYDYMVLNINQVSLRGKMSLVTLFLHLSL